MNLVALWLGWAVIIMLAAATFVAAIGYAYGVWTEAQNDRISRAVDHRLRERASMMRASVYWFDGREDWAALWKSAADSMAHGAYPDVQAVRDAARAALAGPGA